MVLYDLIDHTADFGIQVKAVSKELLFVRAALAMCDQIADSDKNIESHRLCMEITGHDWPDLMVNWLREILYLWNGQNKLITNINLDRISKYRIKAQLIYHYFDQDKDRIKTEIKAVTYHQIVVTRRADQWRARIIFDV